MALKYLGGEDFPRRAPPFIFHKLFLLYLYSMMLRVSSVPQTRDEEMSEGAKPGRKLIENWPGPVSRADLS